VRTCSVRKKEGKEEQLCREFIKSTLMTTIKSEVTQQYIILGEMFFHVYFLADL